MSLLRQPGALPRHTAILLSPWLLVGASLIVILTIGFWAVKNTRQERSNMERVMLERAGALMWAMEGGARAGMGMRGTASYLQFMLEETAKQPDIVYMAVVTAQGEIVAHSDHALVGKRLHPDGAMRGVTPCTNPRWREMHDADGRRVFEVYRMFAPLPGFGAHMRHGGGGHGRRAHMEMMHSKRMWGAAQEERAPQPAPRLAPDSAEAMRQRMEQGVAAAPPEGESDCLPLRGDELIIVIGLDMGPFEQMLAAGERGTLFTALLAVLLGIGGITSLFWAQNYKMSRRQLLDTTALADEVIKNLPVGLMVTDAQGKITQLNEAAEQLLGCRSLELAGRTLGDMQDPGWAGLAARVSGGESILEEEHSLQLPVFAGEAAQRTGNEPDRAGLLVSISASRIINEEGENLGMIYLLRDLREVKRLQAELRRSERLSTLGNMAARVAHEIRNPLSSIKGFATYLGSRQSSAEDSAAVRTMISEVDRLNRVVSELLDFARPSDLRIKDESLGDILERALRLAALDAETKGVALTLVSGREAMPTVPVDAERITQVLLNLLLNAVQATPAGGSISVSVLPQKEGRVGVSIADTGCGMAPEVLAQVFSPYFTTRAQGTGLGLAIVSKIVEDHQGEITMASSPGEGTTVVLRLPLAQRHTAPGTGDEADGADAS